MSASPPTPRKPNRIWIYFFVFVTVASVGVAWFMIEWNRHIQLTPELLDKAEALWKANGPADYNMVYTKKLNDESRVDTFVVEVRGRKVQSVRMNGRPLVKENDDDSDPRVHHSMERLFHDIERFMDMDRKPGATPVYAFAKFSDKTGAVIQYVRRVMGTRQRVEINVTLEAK